LYNTILKNLNKTISAELTCSSVSAIEI